MSLSQDEHTDIINKLQKEIPKEYIREYFRYVDKTTMVNPYNKVLVNLLNKMYSEYRRDDGMLINIPHDDNEYSMMNYLIGNFSCIHIIVNFLNKKILHEASNGNLIATRQLDFKEDMSNWVDEFQNLNNFIEKYQNEILKPNGNGVFEALVKQLERTNKIGKLSEKEMTKFIKMFIPLAKNFVFGGDGDKNDMFKGIDLQFDLGNKTFTLQQKTCYSVNSGKYCYFVSGVGGIKPYDVDYLGFKTSDNELFMFKNNDDVKINEYEIKYENKIKIMKKYVIPNKYFVASKKIKEKKKYGEIIL